MNIRLLERGFPVDENLAAHVQEFILDPMKKGDVTGIFYVVIYNDGKAGYGNIQNKAAKYLPYTVIGALETLKFKLLKNQNE